MEPNEQVFDAQTEEWIKQYALLGLVYLTKAISTGLTVRLTEQDFELFASQGPAGNAIAVSVDEDGTTVLVSLKKPEFDA